MTQLVLVHVSHPSGHGEGVGDGESEVLDVIERVDDEVAVMEGDGLFVGDKLVVLDVVCELDKDKDCDCVAEGDKDIELLSVDETLMDEVVEADTEMEPENEADSVADKDMACVLEPERDTDGVAWSEFVGEPDDVKLEESEAAVDSDGDTDDVSVTEDVADVESEIDGVHDRDELPLSDSDGDREIEDVLDAVTLIVGDADVTSTIAMTAASGGEGTHWTGPHI